MSFRNDYSYTNQPSPPCVLDRVARSLDHHSQVVKNVTVVLAQVPVPVQDVVDPCFSRPSSSSDSSTRLVIRLLSMLSYNCLVYNKNMIFRVLVFVNSSFLQ